MDKGRIPFHIFREETKTFLDSLGVVEDKWWYAEQYLLYLQYEKKGLEWDFQDMAPLSLSIPIGEGL